MPRKTCACETVFALLLRLLSQGVTLKDDILITFDIPVKISPRYVLRN